MHAIKYQFIYSSTYSSYIKEFVHGDFGRTTPNLCTLLDMECDILELDVEVSRYCGLVTQYMATLIWVNIGSGNGLLPDCTKPLTLGGQMTRVSNITIIGSDNGLLPGGHQAIIWTNDWILLIWPLGILSCNFNWNSYIFIPENAFENVVWKMAAIFLSLNALNELVLTYFTRNTWAIITRDSLKMTNVIRSSDW